MSLCFTPMMAANSFITLDVKAGAPSHLNIAGTPNNGYHHVNSSLAVVAADMSRAGTNMVVGGTPTSNCNGACACWFANTVSERSAGVP